MTRPSASVAGPASSSPTSGERSTAPPPGTAKQYRLEAVYFDTPDLRLLRRGVTLRFRRGEEPGDVWTAKLPEETPAHLEGVHRARVGIRRLRSDLKTAWALMHKAEG